MDFLPASNLQLILGVVLALVAAGAAWGLKWLSAGGAIAAFILGAVVFGLGGLPWAAVLLTFFITSSALSKLFKRAKTNPEKFYSKGSRRDAGQVFANGGVAGLFVVAHVFFPDSWLPWMGFVAAFAAANADTWATELGALSRKAPRLITTGKLVEGGTSGGVTLVGTLSALAGSAAVVGVAWWLWPGDLPPAQWIQLLALVLAGLLGSLVDSWLGATVQAIYYCPTCQKETEKTPLHHCGTPTSPLRGWVWLDNDWVNILCTGSGAILAVLVLELAQIF
jgi:uncharacterized protein (TIGR00297 family)